MAVSDTDRATFETSPVPNQSTTMGASAIFGTLLMATMKGSTSRATHADDKAQNGVEQGVPGVRQQLAAQEHLIAKTENAARRPHQEGGNPPDADADLPQREERHHPRHLQQRAAERSVEGQAPPAAARLPLLQGGGFRHGNRHAVFSV